MGDSLVDAEALDTACEILKGAGTHLRLPVDVVIADGFDDNASRQVMDVGPVPEGWRIMDIGPETVAAYAKVVNGAGTVVWNGPMGVFEMPNFAVGTNEIAKTLAQSDCLSIVGGGDSVSAVNQSGVADRISYISTGGGAWLELLEGKTLPGIAALDK